MAIDINLDEVFGGEDGGDGNGIPHCWAYSIKPAGFEMPQDAFQGLIQDKEVTSVSHNDGSEVSAWLLPELRIVPIFRRMVNEAKYVDDDKQNKVLVAPFYVPGGKRKAKILAISPDVVTGEGDCRLFTLGASGTQAVNLFNVVGNPDKPNAGLFHQQIRSPLSLIADPSGKNPLNNYYFHIPLRFASKGVPVESKKDSSKKSTIYPIEQNWGDKELKAIESLKKSFPAMPKCSKEDRPLVLRDRMILFFETIENIPEIRQFFGAVAHRGYIDIVSSLLDSVEEFKQNLIERDNAQISTPLFQFVLHCKRIGLRDEDPVKLLTVQSKGDMQAAVEAANSLANSQKQLTANFSMDMYAPMPALPPASQAQQLIISQ